MIVTNTPWVGGREKAVPLRLSREKGRSTQVSGIFTCFELLRG